MTKKYYSTNEYYYVNPKTKEQEPYTGYVLIEDGKPYRFSDKAELVVGNNYISKVNLTNQFFDRLLDVNLELPKTLEDCTFGANDFLKSSVINQIVSNLEANNDYLFKNCFVSQNDLPLATKIPVLSPYRQFTQDATTGEYDKTSYGPVSNWFWSNISYNNIQDIWDKTDWPETVEGYDWQTDDIINAIVLPTNKPYSDTGESSSSSNDKLFAAFISYPTKIQLMNLYLCPDDILSEGGDPLKTLPDDEVDAEAQKRFFVQYSPANNQGSDSSETNNNLNLVNFSHIDPNNDQSIEFKNITSTAIDSNNLYVIDANINGLFKYDISKCLSDRGAATNKINLVDYIQGFGDLNEPYSFNNPISISAFENTIAILDKGNNVIKVLDNFFNHKFTIRSGAFVRQDSRIVNICPYDFILDEIEVKKGSIWITSEVNNKISIDIFSNTGEYITNKEIKYIELIKEIWYNENNGQPSSNDPISSQEVIKKIDFSFSDSNYFYIITDRRVIKFQLSKLTHPIGIISYYYRSVTLDNLVWENAYQPWYVVQDLGNKLIPWDYDRSKEIITYPQNKCYSITGVEDIDSDIIFNILDNRTYYVNGSVQRVDNYEDNNLLFIDNISKQYTYDKFDSAGQDNSPVLVKVGDTVPKYISNDGTPEKVEDELILIKPVEVVNEKIHNAILFYKEPNILKSSLLKTDINVYSGEELSFKDNKEYYNALTYNKMLHKLYFNLLQIKKYVYGTFVAGYSIDNIMTYDHVSPDSSIQNLGNDIENFYMGENEQTSIVLNRCFMNIYNIQVNILKKMQTKFISTLNYNLNTYKII